MTSSRDRNLHHDDSIGSKWGATSIRHCAARAVRAITERRAASTAHALVSTFLIVHRPDGLWPMEEGGDITVKDKDMWFHIPNFLFGYLRGAVRRLQRPGCYAMGRAKGI